MEDNFKQDNSDVSNYKIWKYKYDIAEINTKNWREIIKQYFQISTKKISLLAMMLTFNVIMTLFSKFVIGLFPISGFFVLEISFFTILLVSFSLNFFYAFIFLEITVWFRLLLGDQVVGLIAMNLTDGFFLIFYSLIFFLIKFIFLRMSKVNSAFFKNQFWFIIFSLTLSILLTSAFAVLINYLFLLELWWPAIDQKTKIGFLPLIFGLNIVKYLINSLLFLSMYKVLIVLINRYRF